MNSLAKKMEECKAEPVMLDSPSYPTLCLRGQQLKSFLNGQRLEMDKVYEVPMRFVVCGVSQSRYDNERSLDIKIQETGDIVEVGEAESSDEDPILKAVGASEDDD